MKMLTILQATDSLYIEKEIKAFFIFQLGTNLEK